MRLVIAIWETRWSEVRLDTFFFPSVFCFLRKLCFHVSWVKSERVDERKKAVVGFLLLVLTR